MLKSWRALGFDTSGTEKEAKKKTQNDGLFRVFHGRDSRIRKERSDGIGIVTKSIPLHYFVLLLSALKGDKHKGAMEKGNTTVFPFTLRLISEVADAGRDSRIRTYDLSHVKRAL